MNDLVEFIAAVERAKAGSGAAEARVPGGEPCIEDLPVHGFPGKSGKSASPGSQNPHPVPPKDGGTRVGNNTPSLSTLGCVAGRGEWIWGAVGEGAGGGTGEEDLSREDGGDVAAVHEVLD